MKPSDYAAWAKRAFLFVEGSLLRRSAAEAPSGITEEFVRTCFVDGLKCAKPSRTNDVTAECDVPWNYSPDIMNPQLAFGRGRSLQHDVAITGPNGIEVAIEVKWLKTNDAKSITQDFWKLAMTHGTAARNRNRCRTFILIGGMREPFQKTLSTLRKHGFNLRWSPQGKARGWPKPTTIKIGDLANKQWGFDTLRTVLKRGDNYFRQPPQIFWEMRCVAHKRSWKTIRNSEWKVVLWEIDHRKPCSKHVVDWSNLGGAILHKRVSPPVTLKR